MSKIIKKIIYYIFLTVAFLILPFSIRNIYLLIIIKSSLLEILINIISSAFIFIYPLAIALIIRYNLKNNKWPFKFLYEDEGEEDE